MSELTREQIELFREAIKDSSQNVKTLVVINALCDMALAALASPWVSVGDRLPEEKEEVLFFDGKNRCYGFRATETQWMDMTYTDRDGDYRDCYEVTHWMPLPPAPAVVVDARLRSDEK